MKKVLLLAALVFASLQLTAANVDLATAQQSAQRFLASQTVNGRFMASAPAIKWTQEVKTSSNAAQAAYYIVNTDRGYVIVAGDDRAREILAYGEGQLDNLNDLPEAMQLFLNMYKKQMEYLQAHPGLKVQKGTYRGGVSVEPLLATAWNQGKPYNMKTPKKGTGQDPYCKVGCSAVALAQVMRYWEYPKTSPALDGYTCPTSGYVIDPLPEYTFDWEHMRNSYPSSSSGIDQLPQTDIDAIAWFMRYVGQAETMDYGLDRSGAEREEIMQALGIFGYRDAHVIEKIDFQTDEVNYNDEEWGELIQSELIAGRPLIYCAFDMSSDSTGIGGHAFNVDGYDAVNDMYHVNFGMSAEKNTYYALHAFTLDNGMTVYDFYPILFADVQDPTLTTDPRIYTSTNALSLECYAGETTTATLNVSSANLTGDITLTLNDANGVFSIDETTIALADAKNATITVTYAPQEVGTHTATITLSSNGAPDVTVTLNGTATAAPLVVYNPVMLPADESKITATSFRADWTDQTVAQNVVSYTLEVNEKPSTGGLIAEADWSNAPSSGEATMPEGWTVGPYGIYNEGGSISITSDSYIKTNTLEIGTDKVTVVFKAKNYYSWTASGLTVSTSVDSKYFEFTSDFVEYTVVLNCAENDAVEFFGNSYYPQIQWIKIYSGEVTAPQLRATEEGDASSRLITGITDKFYTVSGLNENSTYTYRVKALYTDNTESAWSNKETVTLVGAEVKPGDVNGDGNVAIADVTTLIDYLLGGNVTVNEANADVNGQGGITIADVTALIDMLLGAQ
jgi:hypothetical protein